jgi:hypothetical protein
MTFDAPPIDRPRGPVFIAGMLGAFGRTSIWLLAWLATFLLALTASAEWVGFFTNATAHRVAPGELLARLSEVFRFDHGTELAALRARTAEAAAVLGLVAMLFGVFAAGGWLQVFLERTAGHSVRRFLWGGSRYFWRFVRVWLLTLLVLAVVSWIWLGWPWETLVQGLLFGIPDGKLAVLTSERTAVGLGWLQAGGYALTFALTMVWADYTRTRLALLDTRSALFAGLTTLGMLFRHPLRAIRPLGLILALEVLVLFGAGALVRRLSAGLDAGSGWTDVALLFLVGQLALCWRAIIRGARYHATVNVSRDVVPPLARPDPWARRVGGPGGPQYPIDQSDEYGVSL